MLHQRVKRDYLSCIQNWSRENVLALDLTRYHQKLGKYFRNGTERLNSWTPENHHPAAASPAPVQQHSPQISHDNTIMKSIERILSLLFQSVGVTSAAVRDVWWRICQRRGVAQLSATWGGAVVSDVGWRSCQKRGVAHLSDNLSVFDLN